jgi:hypothetical protein
MSWEYDFSKQFHTPFDLPLVGEAGIVGSGSRQMCFRHGHGEFQKGGKFSVTIYGGLSIGGGKDNYNPWTAPWDKGPLGFSRQRERPMTKGLFASGVLSGTATWQLPEFTLRRDDSGAYFSLSVGAKLGWFSFSWEHKWKLL